MSKVTCKKMMIVCDYFSDQKIGGAELSMEAMLSKSPIDYDTINSVDVTEDVILNNMDKVWVFGNFWKLRMTLLPSIMKYVKYFVIESDYKFCDYRSLHLHKIQEGNDCDCHKYFGEKIAEFYKGAECVAYRSQKQLDIYKERFKGIEDNAILLHCEFTDDVLDYMKEQSKNEKEDSYLIISSDSWIKDPAEAIKYCNDHSIKYEVVKGLDYKSLIDKLSRHKGLIHMPAGHDTCPRVTLEAKLLGCDVICNDNVQHKDDDWFAFDNEKMLDTMNNKLNEFYERVINVFTTDKVYG